MTIWVWILVCLAGLASGMLAAVLGVGGAVLTTPVIRAFGATPIEAVGSTVPAILPGALSGTWRYHKQGLVRWRTAWYLAAGGIIFAVLGGLLASIVEARWLMVITAGMASWSGISLIRPRAQLADTPVEQGGFDPPAWKVAALGALAGFLAGLLGIGGGIVLVPGMSIGLKMPMRETVATSLATVSVTSISAVLTHLVLGHVNWSYALPLAVGIIPGALIGSRFTIRASETRSRQVGGALLLVIGLVFLCTELAALH